MLGINIIIHKTQQYYWLLTNQLTNHLSWEINPNSYLIWDLLQISEPISSSGHVSNPFVFVVSRCFKPLEQHVNWIHLVWKLVHWNQLKSARYWHILNRVPGGSVQKKQLRTVQFQSKHPNTQKENIPAISREFNWGFPTRIQSNQ